MPSRWWVPAPVVVAVFATEMIGLWVVFTLKHVYDITLDPIDVRLNMLIFTTAFAWWVEVLTRKP